MRLVGYCTGCGKFRSVRVSGDELARVAGGGHVATGTCSDCERARAAQRAAERAIAAQRAERATAGRR